MEFLTSMFALIIIDLMTKKQKASIINLILKDLFPDPKCELSYTKDYELLFAVIMSAQTTDKQVNIVTNTLFEKYKTLDDYAKSTQEQLSKDISKIGLYNAKAKNLIKTAQLLITKHNSKVPNDFEAIQTFAGAGRKTANVVGWELFGENYGIAVDTHVARMAFRLGLTKNTDPVKIEQDLIKLLPRDQWGNFGHRLILYGRYNWPARQITHQGVLNEYAVGKFKLN
jgi:endonuclease III